MAAAASADDSIATGCGFGPVRPSLPTQHPRQSHQLRQPAARSPRHLQNAPLHDIAGVIKAFSVLHAFTPTTPLLSVGEAALRTGMDRGTTFRLIHTLVSLDYLRPVQGKRFRLTLKCLELGFNALSSGGLAEHAAPLLRECVPDIADAASVGALEGPDVVFLQRVDAALQRNIDRRPGQRYGPTQRRLDTPFWRICRWSDRSKCWNDPNEPSYRNAR